MSDTLRDTANTELCVLVPEMPRPLLFFLFLCSAGLTVQGQCITAYPHLEDFETAPVWTSGGAGNDWAWGTPAHPVINSAGSGTKAWCVGGLTGQFYTYGAQSWIESPCYDLSSVPSPVVAFQIYWEVERQYDGMVMQASTDGGNSWDNVGAFGDPLNCNTANWYNEDYVNNLSTANPRNGWSGRQGATQGPCEGGQGSAGWRTAQHCLDGLGGLSDVRLRFLFGAGTTCNDYDGIAIDSLVVFDGTPNVVAGQSCANGLAQFTSNITGCADGLLWNFGDPASGALNTSADAAPSHQYTTAGTYNVTLTATGGCGQQVVALQQVNIITVELQATSASCGGANGSVEAVVTGNGSPFTYDWTPGGAAGAVLNNIPPGDYAVVVGGAGVCTAEQTITVADQPSDLAFDVSVTDVLCAGAATGAATVQVTAGTATTYLWAPVGGNQATATGLTAGAYSVIVTDPNGCEVAAAFNVNEPAPLNAIPPADATICSGASITLQAGAEGGAAPYQFTWSPEGPIVSPVTDTVYEVFVTDDNGCSSTPVQVTVQVNELPTPSLSVTDSAGCTPHCTAFTAGPAGMSAYAFAYGDGSSGPDASHCYEQPGSFTVALTVTDAAGCSATVEAPGLVTAWPVPLAGIDAPEVVIITELPLLLSDASQGGTQWAWTLPFADSTEVTPSVLFTAPVLGCFPVEQVVINDQGCSDSTSVQICVEDEFSIYAPNAFTPNGDGINEGFTVITSVTDPKVYELNIFDRWGQVLFTGASPADAWKAEGIMNGVYAWNLTLRDSQNKLRKAMGHVVVLR
jgi:gliding motility-associated-like protein